MEITTETSRRTHICPRLGVEVCALVIIDSGNPTDNASVNISLKEIITFCHRESLILLIDNTTRLKALPFIQESYQVTGI